LETTKPVDVMKGSLFNPKSLLTNAVGMKMTHFIHWECQFGKADRFSIGML
jgi:hypothetical protein